MGKKNKHVSINLSDLRPQSVDPLAVRAVDQDHEYRMQKLNNDDAIRREQAIRYRDLDLEELKNARHKMGNEILKARMDKEKAAEKRASKQRSQTQKDLQRNKTIQSYKELQIAKLAAEKEEREAKVLAAKELLEELRKSSEFKERKQAREDALIMIQLRKEEEESKAKLEKEERQARFLKLQEDKKKETLIKEAKAKQERDILTAKFARQEKRKALEMKCFSAVLIAIMALAVGGSIHASSNNKYKLVNEATVAATAKGFTPRTTIPVEYKEQLPDHKTTFLNFSDVDAAVSRIQTEKFSGTKVYVSSLTQTTGFKEVKHTLVDGDKLSIVLKNGDVVRVNIDKVHTLNFKFVS